MAIKRPLTLRTHTEIHSFHHVNKGFVLLVLDVGTAPARGTGGLYGNFRRFFLERILASAVETLGVV